MILTILLTTLKIAFVLLLLYVALIIAWIKTGPVEECATITRIGAFSHRCNGWLWAPWIHNYNQLDVFIGYRPFCSRYCIFDRHTGEYLGVASKSIKPSFVMQTFLPDHPQ
jgi:hypothetical protein